MDISVKQKEFFTHSLVSWHHNDNDRNLPWKNEKDPYRIWLSEIILQQTRAAQGLPYYLRFLEAYPDITAMAGAADEDAYRIWQGLGYYNRCRNMLATARYIAYELEGRFPDKYDDILALKGVGPYTAAAIASFAYGLPHAVVDGNVYRVLSRYFAIDTPFDTTEGKRQFAELAGQLLDAKASAAYNQAIMDLGATVCTPAKPLCAECPLSAKCQALKLGLVDSLPVRSKKIAVSTRYFHYILLRWQGKLWIHQRDGSDIWQGLHQPLLIEHAGILDAGQLQKHAYSKSLGLKEQPVMVGKMKQRLTHRIIESTFFLVEISGKPPASLPEGRWMDKDELEKIAFPKTILSFLKNNLYF